MGVLLHRSLEKMEDEELQRVTTENELAN